MNTTAVSAAPRTNWNQVYSLLALNAALVISWIAYHNYQPKVLEIFHFTELKLFLIIAKGLILVLIIITGYFFRKATGNVKFERDSEEATSKENKYFNVLIAGLTLGFASALIKNYMADWMLSKPNFSITDDSSILVSGVLIISAVAAVPLVRYINKLGITTSLIYGLIVTFASLALIYFIPSSAATIVLSVIVGLSFSFASVAAFPYALSHLSPRHVTLGAGMFFGSVEVAARIINYLQAA